MGNGRRQFSHRRYPADMSQFGLRFAQGNFLLMQLFFRPLALRDVYDDDRKKRRHASSRRDQGTANVRPDHIAVLAPVAFLDSLISSLPSTPLSQNPFAARTAFSILHPQRPDRFPL